MEFGGRTRTAATAGPRRPSDGKIGGLLRPTPMLYGEAEVTESSGSVSMTKGEAVSRLAVRLSPTPNGGTYPLCWTDKRRQRGTRKGKVVWPGGSRRQPTGDRCSLCRTGEDGKVKYGRDA